MPLEGRAQAYQFRGSSVLITGTRPLAWLWDCPQAVLMC